VSALPTSFLYVPGDRPERFDKAAGSGTHAVILDVEDAVALAAKDAARESVVAYLTETHATPAGVEVWVRINAGDRGLEDVRAIAGLPVLTGLVVPKSSGGALAAVRALTDAPLIALVETASAVLDLASIATADGVIGMAMGEVDLAADLGVDPSPDEHELWPFRMLVVATSAAYGLRAPIGPVSTATKDLDGLRTGTEALQRAGFEARQAIHPAQVAVINDVFAPTDVDIKAAEDLLSLLDEGGGVCVDASGRMVDEAVLRRARRVLSRRR
jgi:citrate lyase subunit beta/citryl-CoA lyase